MPKRIFATTALALFMAGCAKPNDNASTQQGTQTQDAISVRKQTMKDWRASMDIMQGMLENPSAFNSDAFAKEAKFMADSPQVWVHFADATMTGGAKETLWQDKAGFDAQAQKFDQATSALLAAATPSATPDSLSASLGAVGESCKSCHQQFKK